MSPPKPVEIDAPPNETVLRASNLKRSFGGTVVLDGISIDLKRGDVVLLRGGNGSGKTTLLNVLTGNLMRIPVPSMSRLRLRTCGSRFLALGGDFSIFPITSPRSASHAPA